MALDAGSVFVTLGGRFDPAAFAQFGTAVHKAGADMEKTEQRSRRMGAAMGAAGTVAKTGLAAGVLAAAAAFGKGMKSAADFQSELSKIQAATGASAKQMGELRQAALDLGAKSGLGPTKVAQAIVELGKGGLSTSKILKGGLAGAIALAQAGQMDLATAAGTVTNALNLFSLQGKDAGHVADALATAANKTTADVSDFAIALSQGGAAAKQAGLGFDDTVSVLMALADASVKGSDAGTAMKSAFLQVLSPTKESAALMKKLGIDFTDAQGRMKSVGSIADMLKDRLGGLTDEQRLQALQTMAGTDGFRTLAALMESGRGGIDRYRDSLGKQGTAADTARKNTDNLKGSAEKLGATFESLAADKLAPVTDALKDATDAATGFLEELRTGQADLGALDGVIDTVSGIADGIGDIASSDVAGALGSDIWDSFVGGAEMAGAAARTMDGLLRGIGRLLQGDLSGAFGAFGDAAQATIDFVAASIRALPGPVQFVVDKMLGLVSSLLSTLGGMADELAGLPIIGGAFDGVADAVRGAAGEVDRFREKIRGVGDEEAGPVVVSVETGMATRALRKIEGTKLEPKVMRVLGSDADAQTKLRRLIRLGIPEKTAQVLANVSPALAGVTTVRAALAALRDRNITITTTRIERSFGKRAPGAGHASGRGPGAGETALVGEGRGPEWIVDPRTGQADRVNGPQIRRLAPWEYVIPTEPAYRGRAADLLGMLARDIGVGAFKKGRKPKVRRVVPAAVKPLALDPQMFDDDVRSLEQQADEKRTIKRKGKPDLQVATDRAKRARRLLSDARKRARQAHDFAGRIQAEEDRANIAQGAMTNADKRDDQKGFDTALKDYKRHLKEEKRLLQATLGVALKHSKGKDNAWVRKIQARLGTLDGNLIDANSAVMQVDKPDVPDPDGLTDVERRQLEDLEAALAVAQLTADSGDDLAALRGQEGILQTALSEVMAGRRPGGSPVVEALARQLRDARDGIAALTGGPDAAAGVSPDQQAQLEQANARAAAAAEEARINAAALAAFTGTGDLGTRGTGVTVINQWSSFMPPNRQDAQRVAAASARGFNAQGRRPAKTSTLGI